MQATTIAQALMQFLESFGSLEAVTSYGDGGQDKYGLTRATDRTVKNCISGAYEITEYYQLYARQIGDSEGNLKECDEWLEALTYWVDDYSLQYDYPTLSGSRHIEKIELVGVPHSVDIESNEMIYNLALTISYVREREDY